MRKLAAIFLLCCPALAANFDSVQGSQTKDAAGNLLATGQICFLGTDQFDNPIGFQAGGGGQITSRAACFSITSGVISAFATIADSNNTNPAGVLYRITVKDLATGQIVIYYKGVQVTGTPWNFDSYAPNPATPLPPVGSTVSGNVAITGNITVTGNATISGTCTGCTTSALQYQTDQNNGSALTQRGINNFFAGLKAADNSGSSRTDVSLAPTIYGLMQNVVAPPALTLSQTVAGALAATTYYVRATCKYPGNTETTAGAESNLAVAINNVLNVTAPTTGQCPASAVTGAAPPVWNVYVSNTAGGGSGAETLQSSNMVLGANWVEPTSGLVGGAAMPSTLAIDLSQGNTFKTTLTANITTAPTFSNATIGATYGFIICEDATGGRSFAWPATFKNSVAVNTAANACTDGEFDYDGTNYYGDSLFGMTTVSFSATPTFDAALATSFKITLTGNVTSSTLSNAVAGTQISFTVCQDATGGRTFVWPTNVLVAPPVASAANACTTVDAVFDGTNARATPLLYAANTLTFSSTPVFDFSNGTIQKLTLTGNVSSSTISNATAGQKLTLQICQDGTGGRTFVWPTNLLGAPVIESAASICTTVDASYDGTNAYVMPGGVPVRLFATASNSTNANISAVTMATAPASITRYRFAFYINETVPGVACTGTTTVILNAIYTDPSAAGSQTVSLGTFNIATTGNGAAGNFVAQGTFNLVAKASTTVQYSTSSYTAGAACTTNPSYQVWPDLEIK